MKHKNRRQVAILNLIKESDIETQNELTLKLNLSGLKVTQATISRDIKQLHLVKVLNPDTNKYRYVQQQGSPDNAEQEHVRFSIIVKQSTKSVKQAQNLVIIKCYEGSASAVAVALDSMKNSSIVGTIAGDDTIFIATENNEQAKNLCRELSINLLK